MQAIKLIAMDMDGTLLDDAQRITDRNMLALREAAAAGVHIAICSGRAPGDVSWFASDAGLGDCYIVALNGACCLQKPHGEPYAVHYYAPGAAEAIARVLLGFGVTFACFQPGRIVVVHGDDAVNKLNWGTHVARGNAAAYAYGEEALRRHMPEGVCKYVYIDRDRAPRIQEVRKALNGIPGIDVTSSWSNNLEIMPSGVNKGTALAELAGMLGLDAAQVMAMGDYDNDLDMIRYAGLGVAMGNASERVKTVADHVTLTNEESGVAEAIRRFVLTA